MNLLRALTLAGVTACTGLAMGMAIAEPEVKLEGKNDRAKLDAISYKPFDRLLLGKLSQWSGTPLTAEAMQGKVVVFVTWASWYKTSLEAIKSVAQRVSDANAEKGVIVVGVHHTKGFEKAADAAKAQGMTFAYALDDQNEFRKALFSTQDPDFYIVDRAGNLRYADIETASVEAAVAFLAEESVETAAAAKPDAKPVEKADAKNDNAPGNYAQPDTAAYKAAKWPTHNKGGLSAGDFQGKPLPKPLGKEKFLDNKKPDRAGKVTVLDFWATWCGPCKTAMPKLDKLQKDNKDVVVIGISDESESTIKAFLSKNKHAYAQATDQTKTVSNAMKVQGIPHVVVLSSDGTIRWQGNPHSPDFEQTVKAVVEADPGVKARRGGDAK